MTVSALAQTSRFLVFLLLATAPAFGQVTNQITAVSPTSAVQGANGLTVTFTLASGSPAPPPAGVSPTNVMLGDLTGSSITHPSQYTVTAQFNIPATEPVGWKNATVIFSSPFGALTYSESSAFQVTAGAGVAAGFSAMPMSGSVPLTVAFTNTSTGTITNQLWNFGDNNTSTAINPSHTYTNTGGFTVSLTVFGPAGSNTLTLDGYITVETNVVATMIVDTMQTNCYNTNGVIPAPSPGQPYYGQDAQLFGNQSSYMLSADGKTVYDNNTGLTWMRGPNTTLITPLMADKMTYPAALNWPATVNATNYGGFSDWRLPTLKELYSLFNCNGTDPATYTGTDTSVLTPFIDTNYFNFGWGQVSLGERLIDSQYATSTTFIDNPSTTGYQKDFGVNFSDGHIKGYDLGADSFKLFFVQLVRGPIGYGINSFTNNRDGTITDQSTGLTWSQADNGSGITWSNALAWVQAMNTANHLGHNDWRLPDVKELQSIVDYSNAPDYNGLPAIDTNYFTCSVITNEAGQRDFPYYWTGTTYGEYTTSNSGGANADYIAFGRALAYPSSSFIAAGYPTNVWIDIHGAGAQRADPKVAPPYFYATVYTVTTNGVTYTGYSFGPEGDALRGFNYVRLVRGGYYSSVDHVGDGIPDGWRRQYFGGSGTTTNATSCASCDADHDGVSNYAEYIADTNPTNVASYFHIQSVTSNGSLKMFYQSSASRKYTLYYTTNLASGAWIAVTSQTNIAGSGGVDSLSDTATGGTQRFYRIGVALP